MKGHVVPRRGWGSEHPGAGKGDDVTRDDRLPRIRVTENHEHMTKCSTCQSNFDTRLFIGCPYCSIENARASRKRRAMDKILPTNPLLGPA